MIQWTEDAEKAFQRYVKLVKRTVEDMEADPQEVEEDLRRHIEEELGKGNSTTITEEDVCRIIPRMGFAYPPASVSREAFQGIKESRSKRFFQSWIWILGCGVVLPVVTLLVELVTRMCSAQFFDPIPTVFHGLLILLVPVANLIVWRTVETGRVCSWRLLGWFHATVMGVTLYYTVVFLPLAPFGLAAIMFWGFGLLPLAPILSFSVAVGLRRRASEQYRSLYGRTLPGLVGGMTLGVLVLQAAVYPATLTRLGMSMAASSGPAEVSRGINFLVRYGDARTLLRAGQQGRPHFGSIDLLGGIIGLWHPVSPQRAREIYYRATGDPFNAAALMKAGIGPVGFIRDDDFDSDQGEAVVGSNAPGVSLSSSRMDGSISPGAALGYLEWTLEFKNDASFQQEARGQMVLPPGGVVSRLTLWVHGEEREAAFGSRARTRQAYEQVVQRRRDPVIVTTCGKDRIAFQCFPIPPGGGNMKIRLGITFPLILSDMENAFLRLPSFSEKNFMIDKDLQHSVWVESKQPIEDYSRAFLVENPKPELYALRGNLTTAVLDSATGVLCAARNPEMVNVWAPDLSAKDGSWIQQRIEPERTAAPGHVVVVLDGSVSMQSWSRSVAESFASFPAGIELTLVYAGRGGVEVIEPRSVTGDQARSLISEKLASLSFKGGCDNIEALDQAWDLASGKPNSVILWIHGPQPVLLGSMEQLIQKWERRPDGPHLLSLQVNPGPDKVMEKLDGIFSVTPVVRLGSPSKDLTRLLNRWSGREAMLQIHREKITSSTSTDPDLGQETSMHLVRLWAKDQIERLRCEKSPESASQEVSMASAYKLVTPLMGAVVLETEQQYQVAGLKVPDAQGIPTIPEPQTWMLILAVILLLAWAVNQQRRCGCLRG